MLSNSGNIDIMSALIVMPLIILGPSALNIFTNTPDINDWTQNYNDKTSTALHLNSKGCVMLEWTLDQFDALVCDPANLTPETRSSPRYKPG